MAEALAVLTETPPVGEAFPPPAPARAVAAFIAQALVPPLSGALDTPWLRGRQSTTARRLVTVLHRHGGALLADPVGSGKTFVALAAARAVAGSGGIAAVVPAPIVEQWRQRAATCGLAVEVLSHAAVSRGKLPADGTRVLIVDECHHFRHPDTQRYQHLARWLAGRPFLAVSATPVVNRAEDLAHQLRLGVRDDALRALGTPSLLAALRRGLTPPSLGELVIASPAPEGIPDREERSLAWDGGAAPPAWCAALDTLALSAESATASLIRGVLWSAAASSPAALRAALGRYAQLLRHARDARGSGITLDRAMLKRFAADVPEQLLFWELLPVEGALASLPLDDLDRVEVLRRGIDLSAPDPKAALLGDLLSDGAPTVVFATSVATVPYLRERLEALSPAWVTGARSGWKRTLLPRDRIFEWFRPSAANVQPTILLASDVAAEGLDLQRVTRVVHYDLPWTAMRLAQREGRSRRLGALHSTVEVVRLDPPRWAEERLRQGTILKRKEALMERTGLAGDGLAWRWRHDLAARWEGAEAREGTAAIRGAASALLALLAIEDQGSGARTNAPVVIQADGGWSEDPAAIQQVLGEAGTAEDEVLDPRMWSGFLASPVREILRRSITHGWSATAHSVAARRLLDRLHPLLRTATKDRDPARRDLLERMTAFAARGHTAGEELLIEAAIPLSDDDLLTRGPGRSEEPAGSGKISIRVVAAIAVVACQPR